MSQKCDICNEFEGEGQSLKMHKVHCAKKHAKEDTSNPLKQEVKQEVQPRERSTPDRNERIPFSGPKKKLPVPEDDKNYQYRYFNDNWSKDPGRIQRAEAAGYKRVDQKPVTVGTNDDGSAIRGILMRIPKEWYEEDKKAKFRELDKVDAAIKGGTLEQQATDKRYIPDGIKIHSNSNENG